MHKNYGLSIILPVYNEEDNISKVIEQVAAFLEAKNILENFEIIIVDDASNDNTAEILRKLANKVPNLKIITHYKNEGYGRTLISGVKNSRYPLVFFMDADGQFELSQLDKLIPYIKDYGIVTGYRERRKDNVFRVALGKLFTGMVFLLLGLKLRDVNCGFKLFRKEIFNGACIFSRAGVFYVEILLGAVKKGYKIKEIPVRHYSRLSGKQTGATFVVISEAIIDFIRLYIKEGMMMKKMARSIRIFLFVIAVVTIFVNSTFAYELERYYPLGYGDSWTYTVRVDDEEINKETFKIEGEEIIDGENTVKMVSEGDDYEFIGIDPEGVKIYKDFSEDRYEIYNPPMMLIPRIVTGESGEYASAIVSYDLKGNRIGESNSTIKIKLEAVVNVEVAAGKFSGCLRYRLIREERMESHDFTERDICTVWLAPNVGMVKDVCVNNEYNEEENKAEISTKKFELISAVIGGKKIGSP